MLSPEMAVALITSLFGGAGVIIVRWVMQRVGAGNGAALRRELREDVAHYRNLLRECEEQSEQRRKENEFLREESIMLKAMLRDKGVEV